MADTKSAEKEYLERTGSSLWEQSKPFSPRGSDTLNESANMLHDFAVAMLTLQPLPDDLILDLGAGGCWCSDLLVRLNRSSIALDISIDMLRAGRTRSGVAIRAVAADMESLPFKTGAFQKAVCLNAIHHVPNIPKAIEEVSRVLTADGVALFSEPGEGHSEAPVSNIAMHGYGVLEQDILVGPFLRHCLAAGFEEVSVQPLSHAIPGFTLTLEQWDGWSKLAKSTRPQRAVSKLLLAFVELLGFGKRNLLFEETLAISMVRTLRQVVSHHPIVVARKSRATLLAEKRWRASLSVTISNEAMANSEVSTQITATNLGTATWKPMVPSGIGNVTLGIQLLDADGRIVSRDYFRARLPRSVSPQDSVSFTFKCPTPAESGLYFLKFDLVVEGVTWFELAGSPAVSKQLRVL
jgi:ubiquinone/menaquinone biosynthesis C-methylase UbiE